MNHEEKWISVGEKLTIAKDNWDLAKRHEMRIG
jgi:hypothetical protein